MKKGDRVRQRIDDPESNRFKQGFGVVIFVNGDDVTVLADGYECSNTYFRKELEVVEA
jgi:hypothetical protein